MNYDTIKILNLESINVDLNKSFIIKNNDKLFVSIVLLKKEINTCPNCGSINTIVKDYYNKKITHSISTDKPCIINYKARRFICKDCGMSFYEKNPFCKKEERVSYYTEALIVDKLKSHTATYSSVARDLNTSIQFVINTFDKIVHPVIPRLSNIICMDEIYTNRLTKRKYCFVMMDFNTGHLLNIFPSRLKIDLINNLSRYPLEERKKVQYIIIDMWDTYNDIAKRVFPYAKVAVDSFHVITHLNSAIDIIRLEVMRKYSKEHSRLDCAPMYYYMLKKFHYFFTKNFDNIYEGKINVGKLKCKWDKIEIRKYLFSIDKILEDAYILKTDYQEFSLTADYEYCSEELDEFIERFQNFPHEAFNVFGNLLQHWKEQIKNSFIRIDNRRLSNGKMEGCNSRLKCLIKNANGFANYDRFKRKCFYVINSNQRESIK